MKKQIINETNNNLTKKNEIHSKKTNNPCENQQYTKKQIIHETTNNLAKKNNNPRKKTIIHKK